MSIGVSSSRSANRPTRVDWLRLGLGIALCVSVPYFAGHAAATSQSFGTTPPAGLGDPEGSVEQLASQFEKSPDTVVADVGGAPITLGMVADRLRDLAAKLKGLPSPTMYRIALDDLIQQRALAAKARELGLDKDSDGKRRVALATDQAMAGALVRRLVSQAITDKAIETLYADTIAGKPGPEEVRFRVIASASESDASAALSALAKGGDFAAIARDKSQDPTAQSGGEIGYAPRDKLTPEIGAVAFALAPGQVNAFPVLSNGLWFVIQVEGRRQQGTPPLALVRDQLIARVTRAAVADIMQKARAAIVVKEFGPTGLSGHDAPAVAK
jgi:peptidyl-prolyl cis-trans isomerase C